MTKEYRIVRHIDGGLSYVIQPLFKDLKEACKALLYYRDSFGKYGYIYVLQIRKISISDWELLT